MNYVLEQIQQVHTHTRTHMYVYKYSFKNSNSISIFKTVSDAPNVKKNHLFFAARVLHFYFNILKTTRTSSKDQESNKKKKSNRLKNYLFCSICFNYKYTKKWCHDSDDERYDTILFNICFTVYYFTTHQLLLVFFSAVVVSSAHCTWK